MVHGHFRRLRTAEARLVGDRMTIIATGPKCSLGLVNVPFPITSLAALAGLTAVVRCESFLRPANSYGACRLGGGWGIEYYFTTVAIRCTAYDALAEVLTVEFDGRLSETHWEVADYLDPLRAGTPAAGRFRCRVRVGGASDSEPAAAPDTAT